MNRDERRDRNYTYRHGDGDGDGDEMSMPCWPPSNAYLDVAACASAVSCLSFG